jgi:CubicO group peptidase (beta-lactamase class C family)
MLDGNKKSNINFAPIFYEGTFGHAGIGGSVAFGDKKNHLGYSFVCNKQQKSSSLYKTSNMLTKALYEAIS